MYVRVSLSLPRKKDIAHVSYSKIIFRMNKKLDKCTLTIFATAFPKVQKRLNRASLITRNVKTISIRRRPRTFSQSSFKRWANQFLAANKAEWKANTMRGGNLPQDHNCTIA